MASLITHTIIPLTLRVVMKKDRVPNILLFFACITSFLPDLDVIAFSFGIPYEHQFGHRGATHSIIFAMLVALLASCFHKYLKCTWHIAFIVIFMSTMSHPILDALTNGGLGIAFFWPFNNERIFFPWQPIEVSPIGLKSFLTPRGLAVIKSELIVVWLPCISMLTMYFLSKSSYRKALKLNKPDWDSKNKP